MWHGTSQGNETPPKNKDLALNIFMLGLMKSGLSQTNVIV